LMSEAAKGAGPPGTGVAMAGSLRGLGKLRSVLTPLSSGSVGSMLGEASQRIAGASTDAAGKAALFRAFARQIDNATPNGFRFAEQAAADGSQVFTGRQNRVLVINPNGRVFRGTASDGLRVNDAGQTVVNFDKLKEVLPP